MASSRAAETAPPLLGRRHFALASRPVLLDSRLMSRRSRQRWVRGLRIHDPRSRPPRRFRVERGIYKNPSTGGFEIEYTDSDGRIRWRMVQGGIDEARRARAEAQRLRLA